MGVNTNYGVERIGADMAEAIGCFCADFYFLIMIQWLHDKRSGFLILN